jgi:hypothetical protein
MNPSSISKLPAKIPRKSKSEQFSQIISPGVDMRIEDIFRANHQVPDFWTVYLGKISTTLIS